MLSHTHEFQPRHEFYVTEVLG